MIPPRLPSTLICLLQAWLAVAQSTPTVLSFNPPVWNFTSSTLPNPPAFALPTANPLVLSIALCSAGSTGIRFFVTNDSTLEDPGPSDVDNISTFEIELESGAGDLSIVMNSPGYLGVYNTPTTLSFQVGLSTTAPVLQVLDTYPLLGDTTSNQALLFSPSFAPQPFEQPSYPNYTLPPANLTFPQWNNATALEQYSIFITKTPSTVPLTACAMAAAAEGDESSFLETLGSPSNLGLWLRSASEGWRWQYLVNGLMPSTNYTAYGILNGTQVTQPINFATKTPLFSCPLVHSLPYCPGLSYAAPLTQPPDPAVGYTAADLPSELTGPLLSALGNFTTILTTLACGRDMYSELVTCADCQAAYRAWLCLVSLPRCSEYPPNGTVLGGTETAGAQAVLPALTIVNASATPRNAALPPFENWYYALQPCLEACNAVDRACPPFLGFKCPIPYFNAADSYGVGYIDSGVMGQVGGGTTGTAQDQWGNVWCGMP